MLCFYSHDPSTVSQPLPCSSPLLLRTSLPPPPFNLSLLFISPSFFIVLVSFTLHFIPFYYPYSPPYSLLSFHRFWAPRQCLTLSTARNQRTCLAPIPTLCPLYSPLRYHSLFWVRRGVNGYVLFAQLLIHTLAPFLPIPLLFPSLFFAPSSLFVLTPISPLKL